MNIYYFHSQLILIWNRHCSILPKSHCISNFCEVCMQKLKRVALLIKLFQCNQTISNVTAGFNNTRQRGFLEVKPRRSIFIENLTKVPLKPEKSEIIDFYEIYCEVQFLICINNRPTLEK